jgi:hypothetical protein
MKFILVLLFAFTKLVFFAQEANKSKDSIPHPYKKAMLYSACIPGAGQIYNTLNSKTGTKKAYWKVPLIYGALGTTGYFLVQNQKTQKSLKEEYSYRMNNGSNLSSEWNQYDDQAVLSLYRQTLNLRDLSILAVAAVYFIQIADAGVEAHFLSFDVSEKLTLNVEPTILQYKTTGIRLELTLR